MSLVIGVVGVDSVSIYEIVHGGFMIGLIACIYTVGVGYFFVGLVFGVQKILKRFDILQTK